jgi:hypothetical protein
MTRTILRPSSAPIWAKCVGSHVLEALYPEDEDGPKAREGTAAHFYVTEAVQGRYHPVGTLAPNGHPIDAEMVEAGQSFINDVLDQRGEYGCSFRVETHLTMHGLIHPDCEGTPDAYLLDLAAKRLIVWDYKYGHGYVEPFGNEQMLCYVAGVFEAYELDEADVRDLAVSIRIVQPRNYDAAGPVRTWDTTGAVVWAEIAVLSQMAYASKEPNPPTLTGPQCRHCEARHACPALQSVAMSMVDVAGRSVPRGLELKMLTEGAARLKARIEGLEEIALATVRKGGAVPHWTIGHSKARERWAKPVAEVLALGDMMGVDLRKPLEPITPAQAREKGLDAAVTAVYSERPSGAAKLVPFTDTTAKKAFS